MLVVEVGTIFSIIVLTSSLPSYAADATAAAFVTQRKLGANLGTIAYTLALRTVTFSIMVSTMGMLSAETLVRKKLRLLQPKYQIQWDKNLAESYAEFFTSEELKLATDGSRSIQFARKLIAKQGDVGLSMETKSTPVLVAFVSEAMHAAFKASVRSAR